MAIAAEQPQTLPEKDSRTSRWLDRLDRWCERVGDWLNPILVKETRQALKSRQFVVTFSLLLLAALGWTIIGSLTLMPQIYTTPSAPRMLIGYYLVLAVPMLLVVPLAAYRSLEGEIDDGTLELLSISVLTPWQIVLGKLASAMLQMLLYFIALFPCVAYAYTLRGVDLPTTALLMGILAVSATFMTMFALMFAPLARSRTGRIFTLLVVLGSLLLVEYLISAALIGTLSYGNPASPQWTVYGIGLVVIEAAAIGHLFLAATAAQLMPESENRSTRLRLAYLAITVASVGLVAYALVAFPEESEPVFVFMLMFLASLWTLGGSMFVAESPEITPRIRRELPSTFVGRAFLTFLTPGPATGLIFSCLCAIAIAAAGYFAIEFWYRSNPNRMWSSRGLYDGLASMLVLFPCYLITFLAVSRWMVAALRWKANPRVEIGVVTLTVVAVLAALIPYSVELYLNEYNASEFDYSSWQVTNWAWTLSEASGNSISTTQHYVTAAFTLIVLLVHLALLGKVVRPRRIATPERVLTERQRGAAA